MKKIVLSFVLIIAFSSAFAQTKKKQILLIGTFHFANPGQDVAKVNTFDVMSDKSQKELEDITNKIKDFAPDKFFVEWNYKKQDKLDKLFASNTDSLLRSNADERIQLALRTAKKLGRKRLLAIDYNQASFPYDSLLKGMKEANQLELLKRNEGLMASYEKSQNEKISKYSLTKLLLDYNSKESVAEDLGWYLGIGNVAGKIDNFVGAFLVSEWYRRNLYMYSLIQKLTEAKDNRIMVLLGASHAAMMREFIKYDPNFEVIELETILK